MIKDPKKRDDLSKFLIHLTRDYSDSSATDNLVNILKQKKIKAKNPYCLFIHKLNQMDFSKVLKKKFNTVCLTETPLTQINMLSANIPNRKIKLKPYGLIFWKDDLLEKGANPAIYINARGTKLRNFLLNEFENQFSGVKTLKKFKENDDFYNEIIQYYSLINIISTNHDFSWEREWRFLGDLKFDYKEIVAIIAEDPDSFEKECEREINKNKFKKIQKIPIIDPNWNYEEVIEEMSYRIWNTP